MNIPLLRISLSVMAVAVVLGSARAAEAPKAKAPAKVTKASAKKAEPQPPAPTVANLPYGTHERQVLDFWRAESAKPTPLLFFIHGGGWQGGDKSRLPAMVEIEKLRAAGISVVSINYRFVSLAQAAGIEPPVKWPLEDARRALQFVRSKAAEWNLDKRRIAASGGSAGACSSLWLALHDDMADAKSADPIARESTRLWCAAVSGPQTSLDPKRNREWIPNSRYGGHAFGFRKPGQKPEEEFQAFHDNREKVLPWIREYSPMEHASADDPPLYLYGSQQELAVKGTEQKDPTHSALFSVMLAEKLQPLGVEVIVNYPGKPDARFATITDYLIATLKK
jgi:acetyl esterase/lipase